MSKNEKSLAVLGLDALSWNYLYKLFDGGVMPYTKQLLQKSFKAILEAYPPVTPPSWSSIMTGVNPGKHGIFGFFHYDKETWSQRLYNAYDLKHPRLHEMLSFLGRRSIVFNPIPDYPIIPVKHSEIISNLFFTPRPISYPAEAYTKYFGRENPQKYTKNISCKSVEEYKHVLSLYEEAVCKAVDSRPPLLWVTLNIPDMFFHRCPKLLEEKSISREEDRIFSRLDKIIKLLDENFDSTIIVSDHGFTKYDKLVSINDILLKHGFVTTTNRPTFLELGEYKLREGIENTQKPLILRISPKIYKLAKQLKIKPIVNLGKKVFHKITGKKIVFSTSSWVDIKNSSAAMPEHNFFGILVKNNFKIEKIMDILKNYSDYIYYDTPRNIYSGPYLEEAPDIIVFPRFEKGYWITANIIGTIITEGHYYAHHPNGVLIVRSDKIPAAKSRLTLPNYIVATLALHTMEMPLSVTRDKHPFVEEIINGAPSHNYVSRWSIFLKTLRVKKKL